MTGFTLKIIAIVSMTIDHLLNAGLISQLTFIDAFGMSLPTSYCLINLIQPIGRIAFPIFAYMVGEGCRKTSNIRRYIARLFLFALISEVPFDLALSPVFLLERGVLAAISPFSHLNIFFTLAFAASAIALSEYFKKQGKPLAAVLLPLILFALLGWILQVDYLGFGILLIFAAYFPSTKNKRLLAMATVLALLYLGYSSYWFTSFSMDTLWPYLAALSALVLLYFYNGRRGPKIRWMFYLYYPAHLIIIFLLRSFLIP